MGSGYPSVLAAVLNWLIKHRDYGPVPFSALSVGQMPVTVMYTLYYFRKFSWVTSDPEYSGLFGMFLQ